MLYPGVPTDAKWETEMALKWNLIIFMCRTFSKWNDQVQNSSYWVRSINSTLFIEFYFFISERTIINGNCIEENKCLSKCRNLLVEWSYEINIHVHSNNLLQLCSWLLDRTFNGEEWSTNSFHSILKWFFEGFFKFRGWRPNASFSSKNTRYETRQ